MEWIKIFLPAALALVVLSGCSSGYQVSLVSQNPPQEYVGRLTFETKDQYTGTLKLPKGPNGESFKGQYTCVDTTATAVNSSSVGGSSWDNSGSAFVAGRSSGVAHAEVKAVGYWTGIGNRGSTLNAAIQTGRGGHGVGTAKHSDGKEYRISF